MLNEAQHLQILRSLRISTEGFCILEGFRQNGQHQWIQRIFLRRVAPVKISFSFFFVGGVKSSQANRAIDRDFERKGAQDSFIGPHSTLNMILFVPNDYFRKDFTVRMNNTTSGETFVVDMQCQ